MFCCWVDFARPAEAQGLGRGRQKLTGESGSVGHCNTTHVRCRSLFGHITYITGVFFFWSPKKRDRRAKMRRRMPPRPRPRDQQGKGGAAPPPQIYPVDMNLVKGILREYDRGAYGEEFRGDRLAKIGVLGKGERAAIFFALSLLLLCLVYCPPLLGQRVAHSSSSSPFPPVSLSLSHAFGPLPR